MAQKARIILKNDSTPIVLVHGILSNAKAMNPVQNKLKELYPQKYITTVEIGNGKFDSAFMDFDNQVQLLYRNIKKDINLQHGFNLLCHSQGSHLCLTMAVRYGKQLNINTMILESGAFMGWNCLDQTDIVEYKCFIKGQQKVSNLLQKIPNSVWDTDNNKQNQCIKKLMPQQNYKENLLSVNKIILVASKSDGVIVPYQSSHFGYFKDFNNGDYSIVPLEQQQLYKDDWIGLKYLKEHNRLLLLTLKDIKHTDYNTQQYQNYLGNVIYKYFN